MISDGLCQCGCGQPTPIAKQTKSARGAVKGQHLRYLHGHGSRRHRPTTTEPRLCECGCGQPTPIATRTDTRWGKIKGQPLRFITGHNARLAAGARLDRRPTCRCGCGQPAPLIRTVGGPDRPRPYIIGHEPDHGPLFIEAAAEIVMAVHDGGPDDFREHLADALALDTPDGVTPTEALVAALAALVDPDTRTATVTPVRAYLVALQDTAGAA